ncbi:hypothetical protein [Burkholderia sp. Ap-962]|nr:hypothetical protein [Burkholderia sp. Ap-962]
MKVRLLSILQDLMPKNKLGGRPVRKIGIELKRAAGSVMNEAYIRY